jgi:hypothetical protein
MIVFQNHTHYCIKITFCQYRLQDGVCNALQDGICNALQDGVCNAVLGFWFGFRLRIKGLDYKPEPAKSIKNSSTFRSIAAAL